MKPESRKKISLHTIGCRLNQYETEKMAASLVPYGFERAKPGEKADLYLINTCTVTHRADSSSRNAISRAARENPSGRIVVAGCYVDSDPEKIIGMTGVDVIIPNGEKGQIDRILPGRLPDLFTREPDKGCSEAVAEFADHNRAWLKISDGCNQWCSFCILPTVRGRLTNREPREIIREVQALSDFGFYEVVLTGIHIGHYKNRKSEPQVKNLAALLSMVMCETNIGRLRLSSIEPQTVRDDLIRCYTDSNGRLCRHWHLPLQSGSSRILKLMRRPYDQNTYIRRASAVKEAVPDTIIGADVIVGFPGETNEDFERTCRLAKSGLIDYLHVFSYSDRQGTVASELTEKVNPETIKERNAILSRISREIRLTAHKRQIGKILEVISEHKKREDTFFYGVSDNYLKVKIPGSLEGGKRPVRMKITAAFEDYLEGEVVS
jgi:threonylcarbamoyladenosine tRNA methylthiotransferase MtaB